MGGEWGTGATLVAETTPPELARLFVTGQAAKLVSATQALSKSTDPAYQKAQQKRLEQIDLQWRGPLAMADPKIAEQMNLTQAQRTGIATALQNFRAVQMETFQAVFQGMRPTWARTRMPFTNRDGSGSPKS